MGVPLSGPGIGLPFPQNYYPSQLLNASNDPSSDRVALAPGEIFLLPAGNWLVSLGGYMVLQYKDPVTSGWVNGAGAAFTRTQYVTADGYNVRIANLTGCVVGANIVNAGSGYVQASTSITAIGGFNGAVPTFLPIVGGALAQSGSFTLSPTTSGAGYGVAPQIVIPPPPPASNNPNGVGGMSASAYAVIASGTISAISITNQGAGYPVAPPVAVVPSPFDPNLSVGITAATISLSLVGTGSICGVICTNNGSPLPSGGLNSVTLALAGAGSSGSLSAIIMQTIVSGSVSGPGVGYGTAEFGVTTIGGVPAASAIAVSPAGLRLSWLPRPAQIGITSANTSVSAGSPAVVYDGGLFLGTPTIMVGAPAGAAAPSTIATIAVAMGSRPDIAGIQAAP